MCEACAKLGTLFLQRIGPAIRFSKLRGRHFQMANPEHDRVYARNSRAFESHRRLHPPAPGRLVLNHEWEYRARRTGAEYCGLPLKDNPVGPGATARIRTADRNS